MLTVNFHPVAYSTGADTPRPDGMILDGRTSRLRLNEDLGVLGPVDARMAGYLRDLADSALHLASLIEDRL